MMKKLFIYNALLLTSLIPGRYAAHAQNDQLDWVRQVSGSDLEQGVSITSDIDKNLYLGGNFKGSPELAPGLSVTSNGAEDLFIAKFDTQGNPLWIKNFGGTGTDIISALDAAAGDAIYFGGVFRNKVDFEGTELETGTKGSGFIGKLDTSGNVLWVKQFGSSAQTRDMILQSLAAHPDGSVSFTGYIESDTVDMDPGPGVTEVKGQAVYYGTFKVPCRTTFVTRLDADGNFLWTRQFDPKNESDAVTPFDIEADKSGNIYLGGIFNSEIDFDPGPGVHHMTGIGTDAFIVKLTGGGELIWARKFGGTRRDHIHSLALAGDTTIYATGIYRELADMDHMNPGIHEITSNGEYDIFVLRLDSAGNTQWAQTIGGTSSEQPWGIAADQLENVYVTGQFEGNINLSAAGLPQTIISNGSRDVITFRLDPAGQMTWAKAFGSYRHNKSVKSDIGSYIHADRSNNVYITGYYSDTVDVNQGSAPVTDIYNKGNFDAFLVKYVCTDTSYTTIHTDACNEFLFNGVSYTESGSYLQQFYSGGGCDSIIYLELSISYISEPEINVSGDVLTATEGYSAYRWLMDGNLVEDADGPSYRITENGRYEVIGFNEQGCSDTSRSYLINNVGVSNGDDLYREIKISPNPARDFVYIQSHIPVRVSLYSPDGRMVHAETQTSILDLTGLTPGIYLLRVSDTEGAVLKTERLIRQ